MENISNDINDSNSFEKIDENSNSQEESSIYSDACSNSIEINLLYKNKNMRKSKSFDKEYNNIYENNIILNKKVNQNTNNLSRNLINKDNLKDDNNIKMQSKNINNNYFYLYENNSNSNSLISNNDISNNIRRGSGASINSTKSSLLSKINLKNLSKIKIDIPNKGYLNNRYIINNNKQLLTPIEEKDKGTYNYTPSILSCENKNKNIDKNEFNFMRQTLDPKIKKFLFTPKNNKNAQINEIKEIKNDKESENRSNIENKYIKNKIFDFKKHKKYIYDSDNEENENLNIDDIIVNNFNFKTLSKEKYRNKSDNKFRTSSSFHLGGNEFSNNPNNYSFIFRKTPSINSTLNVKRALKFDKLSEIDLNNIKYNEIDLNYLKSKLRTIPIKVNKIPNIKNRYIKTLLEVQNFFIEDSAIWIIKISHNYEYLATGSKNGSIKIFPLLGYNNEEIELIYNKKNFIEYLKLIPEKPFLELKKHTKDIIDLSWSPFNYDLLLSASLDHYVILWDISKKENNIIKKFDHNEIITCISFSPTNPNIFISGCFDRFIRIFTIEDSIIYKNKIEENNNENEYNNSNSNIIFKKRKSNILNDSISTIIVNNNIKNINNKINNNSDNSDNNLPNYFNIDQIITSVAFFPEGDKVAIGTHNGKILVYAIFPKISYLYNFICRNRLGKYSSGKKITSIEFTDRNKALITTSDSRIRYISMRDGKIIKKYKGHVNLNSMIRCSSDLCNDVLISGSENNFCYIWSLNNKENKEIKNYRYEYFKPFAVENIYCSIIVPEFCYTNYIKKIYKYTTKINILSIIINATDNGRLEVLLNVDEN